MIASCTHIGYGGYYGHYPSYDVPVFQEIRDNWEKIRKEYWEQLKKFLEALSSLEEHRLEYVPVQITQPELPGVDINLELRCRSPTN